MIVFTTRSLNPFYLHDPTQPRKFMAFFDGRQYRQFFALQRGFDSRRYERFRRCGFYGTLGRLLFFFLGFIVGFLRRKIQRLCDIDLNFGRCGGHRRRCGSQLHVTIDRAFYLNLSSVYSCGFCYTLFRFCKDNMFCIDNTIVVVSCSIKKLIVLLV